MSYLSETSNAQRIGLVIGLLVCGAIVRVFWAGGVEELFNPAKRVENQIVEALESRPGDLAILQAMEAYFPQEYDDLLEDMSEAALDNASPSRVAEVGNQQLARFMARHPNDFAAAPDEALVLVLQREGDLLDGLLTHDPVLCADFLLGRMEIDDPLPDALTDMLGRSAAAKIRAMAAGRADQQLRFKTTPRDIAALEESMRAQGADDMQIAMFLSDPSASDMLDDTERCEGAIYLIEGIKEQEKERRALLVATFLTPRL